MSFSLAVTRQLDPDIDVPYKTLFFLTSFFFSFLESLYIRVTLILPQGEFSYASTYRLTKASIYF